MERRMEKPREEDIGGEGESLGKKPSTIHLIYHCLS